VTTYIVNRKSDSAEVYRYNADAQKLATDLGVKLTAYDPTPGAQTAGQPAQSDTAGQQTAAK